MGPKIGKPTQLMDWITAGIKRGPYMLRIALPFPGHVPSAHRPPPGLPVASSRPPGLAPFLLVAAPAPAGTVRSTSMPAACVQKFMSLTRDSAATLASKGPPPGPPGRLRGPYAPQAASQEVGATADGSPLWPRRFPRPASCPFQQQNLCSDSHAPPRSRAQTEMT